jgi:peptidoglycan/xylan/chitin deacetylase (PgdA/CDA1 family)
MRLIKTPKVAELLFPSALWRKKNAGRQIFLTFDDGPSSRTQEILDLLDQHGVQATFFCVGQNVLKHPKAFERIKAQGHAIGNHTFSHVKGLKTSAAAYWDEIKKADEIIGSKLFRPPYGKMKWRQYRKIKRDFRVVMWSHLTYDFDQSMSPERFIQDLNKTFQGGEIIVLHDNIKFFDQSLKMLSLLLKWAKQNQVSCHKLEA